MANLILFYQHPGLAPGQLESAVRKINSAVEDVLTSIETELCYYVEVDPDCELSGKDTNILKWILSVPFHEENLALQSQLKERSNSLLIEIGPRLNFSTPFSTNSVSICHSLGLNQIKRIESSVRYLIFFKEAFSPSAEDEEQIVTCLHDKMTQCCYKEPLRTFELQIHPEPGFEVDILNEGRVALEKANKALGLAFDSWDLDYYTKLFQEKVKRNPTSVECFDLAQSNSEHSRHWFFKGRLIVDGKEWPNSLFDMVMATQSASHQNNVIKFNDNSSAIRGFPVRPLAAEVADGPGRLLIQDNQTRHIIFTAETHNFPTGVAPFPGATTGTGGRIRDIQATGRGAYVIAGTAGYSFGSLHIPVFSPCLIPDVSVSVTLYFGLSNGGKKKKFFLASFEFAPIVAATPQILGYNLPWEDDDDKYPSNFALPVDVAVEASNGASDYGNKFGEPVLAGFARSYGLKTSDGERREYIKPIMFSGGIGMLDSEHMAKDKPQKSMDIVKIGGPVYRIGVGGGAASSVEVQGDSRMELDFSAVQRGDAEMEQKMNRVVRACAELGVSNPIRSIHDQGAGGNGNVLKELAEPKGAIIRAEDFELGDPTISILELWGAEYQESNAALVNSSDLPLIKAIGKRERCTVCNVGNVTGTGKIELENFKNKGNDMELNRKPVDLELDLFLGSMPRKVFEMKRSKQSHGPLYFPEQLTVPEALSRVLRLPSVASKRYLTNKVDRSVTGLVAQQQCVGPLHTPLSDVAVVALSHFDVAGAATAIGEQPIKGLLDPAAGARMSVAEALTNIMFASITDMKDIKCSGNWMWPAKLDGEGTTLFDACMAMCKFMTQLGVAVDGGKDSLSMAARVHGEVVKAPGTLVISAYVGCPDITLTITPDLKCPSGEGILLYLPMSGSNNWHLGGSALAHCFKQLGDQVPDVDATAFLRTFQVVQDLISNRKLLSGHDVSDGGLLTCLLEMAFAGNCGLAVDIPVKSSEAPILNVLFAEETGAVLEICKEDLTAVETALKEKDVPYLVLGKSIGNMSDAQITVAVDGSAVLKSDMHELRDIWEETSFILEKRQADILCVQQEQTGLKFRKQPQYTCNFNPDAVLTVGPTVGGKPRVAVIREEGSNGDREMAAAFLLAGFETWDVNMEDLMRQKISLSAFRGLAFVGGFSYADVCGSAKGWAATARFNKEVNLELMAFKSRPDTFSFGACNGCQLMALLGWIAPDQSGNERCSQGLLLDHNNSGRFESRFATIRVEQSPAIMFKEMGGTVWGMWVAHGEGRFVFKNPDIQDKVEGNNLIPIRYVDDEGSPTEVYPLNPTGSPSGIAGICSVDGRHLAIMPHPERCVWNWQCPWMPYKFRGNVKFSPWLKMFQNAYKWCCE